MSRWVFVIAGVIGLAHPAFAGAWLQPKGRGLAITQASYYTSSHYFDADGNRQSQPQFRKYELQPYAEYGLTETLTIGGTAYINEAQQSGRQHSGIADPEFFVRTPLWNDATQWLSLEPRIKLPSLYPNHASPRSGSRSTDVELALLYGRNQHLFTAHDYVDTRIAYRARNRGQSDQLRADAAIGFKVNETLELVPTLRTTLPLSPDESAPFQENGEQDYSLVKAEISAFYHLANQQWIQATLSQHVAGSQTGQGTGVSLGFAQGF